MLFKVTHLWLSNTPLANVYYSYKVGQLDCTLMRFLLQNLHRLSNY